MDVFLKWGYLMNLTKRVYVCLALSFITIANYSLGLFFLSALPDISSYFHASKYTLQLSYPLVLLGSSTAYLYIGILSDSFGSKKILLIQLGQLFVSCLVCYLSNNVFIFLLGIFMQGMSSYYALIVRYCKIQLDFDVVQLLSILGFIGTVFTPLSVILSSYLLHYSWRYIFLLWMIISAFCLALICFLPTKSGVTYQRISFTRYVKDFKFFFTNIRFISYLILMGGIGSCKSIFYTLSPYVFIKDFGLTAKIYATYLFIPTAGCLIGNVLTPIVKKRYGQNRCIFLSECVALGSIIFFVVIFYYLPYPQIFMILIAVFMISYQMLLPNIYVKVMGINISLAGSSLSFLSVGLNLINGGVGLNSAKQDGEQMGLLMLAVLLLSLCSYHYLNKKAKSEN